jgi:hypothetical protein
MTNPFYATALLSLSLCAGHAASLPEAPTIPGPSVVAAIGSADYCYARVRGIVPERMPPSYLVLELHIKVAYRNPGPRPLLMPTEHERAVYSAIKPGVMNLFREMPDFLQPSMKTMKELPATVSPKDPFSTNNGVFTLIPAGGQIVSPMVEDIVIPVNHKSLIRRDPDIRGKHLYIRMSLLHQEMTPELEADLSDRWSRIGVPWTGELMTNVMTIDVPQQPVGAGPCTDGQPATRF